MKVVVTGGAGFIGSSVCRYLIQEKGWEVLNLDKLTYAANLASLDMISHDPKYHFKQIDICDFKNVETAFHEFQPTAVLHLAAESHVDRSIGGPNVFIQTNIIGTYTLLEVARSYFDTLSTDQKDKFRFLHVSTDEVYGSLGRDGVFTEETAYAPNSPYSASKASSDHLVRAWYHTYGLPVIVSNCSNNYGPYQFPEKLIPLMILNILHGKKLPVYGDGQNIRDRLHVDDHVKALILILEKGEVGEKYNVGGDNEVSNLTVVKTIFNLVKELKPDITAHNIDELLTFVEDRAGHDWRYAIDAAKISADLGWRPEYNFSTGLRQTVEWYLENQEWWQPILERNSQT